MYYTLELASYQGTTNQQAAQKILVRLMAFLGSDDIQYLKDHSNQDLYHRLKTKAVCELEDVIRQQQEELGVITAERDHLVEYKGLVEGENEERAKEVEELRRALSEERARRAESEAECEALCDQIKEVEEEARKAQRRYEVARGEAEVFKVSNNKLEEQLRDEYRRIAISVENSSATKILQSSPNKS